MQLSNILSFYFLEVILNSVIFKATYLNLFIKWDLFSSYAVIILKLDRSTSFSKVFSKTVTHHTCSLL